MMCSETRPTHKRHMREGTSCHATPGSLLHRLRTWREVKMLSHFSHCRSRVWGEKAASIVHACTDAHATFVPPDSCEGSMQSREG